MNASKPLTMALVGALLGGCASVTSLDGERLRMGSDAFASYVESVFRAQNAVATDLAFALESAAVGGPRFARLDAAEAALIAACAGLNDLALERRDGASPGGLDAARRARTAPDCERATRDAERALAAD